jgi:hypothetical protein
MQFAVNFAVWQFCSNEMADEIEEFFASRVHPSLGGALWLGGGAKPPQAIVWLRPCLQDLLKRLARKKS